MSGLIKLNAMPGEASVEYQN